VTSTQGPVRPIPGKAFEGHVHGHHLREARNRNDVVVPGANDPQGRHVERGAAPARPGQRRRRVVEASVGTERKMYRRSFVQERQLHREMRALATTHQRIERKRVTRREGPDAGTIFCSRTTAKSVRRTLRASRAPCGPWNRRRRPRRPLLELVHDATGPSETDAQLALQHRRRTGLRANDQVTGLGENSSSSSLDPPPSIRRGRRARRARSRSRGVRPARATLRRRAALRSRRPTGPEGAARRSTTGHEQHVALADEAFGARLVRG